jgi:hypothetical protein
MSEVGNLLIWLIADCGLAGVSWYFPSVGILLARIVLVSGLCQCVIIIMSTAICRE